MSKPMKVGDIMLLMAADPKDEFGQCLRKCPFIQEKLMSLGLMSFDDLSEEESSIQRIPQRRDSGYDCQRVFR